MDIQKLKFPIGEYAPNRNPDKEMLSQWIKVIEDFPSKLECLIAGVSIENLIGNIDLEAGRLSR